MKPRAWILAAALAAGGGALGWLALRDRAPADPAPAPAAPTAGSGAPALAAPAGPALPPPPAPPAAPAGDPALASGAGYPVNLDDLRARIPDNRYWELDAPTSDPAVAKARAERAKQRNALLGRTQTGEATEPEIRAYYAEQRRISQDYLQLSLLVLSEKGDQLSDRDRGLFELSAQLHRARLQQIARDLTDALARRRLRGP